MKYIPQLPNNPLTFNGLYFVISTNVSDVTSPSSGFIKEQQFSLVIIAKCGILDLRKMPPHYVS